MNIFKREDQNPAESVTRIQFDNLPKRSFAYRRYKIERDPTGYIVGGTDVAYSTVAYDGQRWLDAGYKVALVHVWLLPDGRLLLTDPMRAVGHIAENRIGAL